jgi:hypothetical protein
VALFQEGRPLDYGTKETTDMDEEVVLAACPPASGIVNFEVEVLGRHFVFEQNVSGMGIDSGTKDGAIGVVSGRCLYHSPCVSPTPTLRPASTPDAESSKTRSSSGKLFVRLRRWWFLPRPGRFPALALDVYRVNCAQEPSSGVSGREVAPG